MKQSPAQEEPQNEVVAADSEVRDPISGILSYNYQYITYKLVCLCSVDINIHLFCVDIKLPSL